jgi:thiol-disulfide isomerase/thioredoxin
MRTFRSLLTALALCLSFSAAHAAPAPEFAGIDNWINSAPLTMQQLRGKVVLIDFWTYDCINCQHTLPWVKEWHRKYKDQGLVVVGVHTPEYGFERSLANLRTAVARNGITYPVAQDNRYLTWNAWSNRYWPGFYLVDKAGQVVYTHFGEGNYAQTDSAIQNLLAPVKKPAS